LSTRIVVVAEPTPVSSSVAVTVIVYSSEGVPVGSSSRY
jgi:hypothetical protein